MENLHSCRFVWMGPFGRPVGDASYCACGAHQHVNEGDVLIPIRARDAFKPPPGPSDAVTSPAKKPESAIDMPIGD